QVSDAEDETRLRLFSERETYKVGETLALDVHSRIESSHEATKPRSDEGQRKDAPLLALITYEGEEIIGYRTLEIAPGHNAQQLPLTHEHFPNFAVGASVMAGNRFYSASRAFSIQRQLNITLNPIRPKSASDSADSPLVLRPRDTLGVEITVTDHLGKPVA